MRTVRGLWYQRSLPWDPGRRYVEHFKLKRWRPNKNLGHRLVRTQIWQWNYYVCTENCLYPLLKQHWNAGKCDLFPIKQGSWLFLWNKKLSVVTVKYLACSCTLYLRKPFCLANKGASLFSFIDDWTVRSIWFGWTGWNWRCRFRCLVWKTWMGALQPTRPRFQCDNREPAILIASLMIV